MFNKFRYIAVVLVAFTGMCLLYGCSSTTWKDAKQADSYKSYQSYIADNPYGDHLTEAKKRAEMRYWASLKNDTAAAAFKTYLNKYPKGQFRSRAQAKINQITAKKSNATKARVTGSGVIIRSNHTTESSSNGVVAKKGTVVQILDRYSSGSNNEAILNRNLTVDVRGDHINLVKGKAIRIVADRGDSVHASFTTPQFGMTEATINKAAIETMSDQLWYKIHTKDDITGWIYGKFVKELQNQ